MRKLDSPWIGLIIGLLLPIIGFFLFGFLNVLLRDSSFDIYMNLFNESPDKRASMISISLVFNLLAFYFLLNKKLNNAAKGILSAVFVYGIWIVYIKFLAEI